MKTKHTSFYCAAMLGFVLPAACTKAPIVTNKLPTEAVSEDQLVGTWDVVMSQTGSALPKSLALQITKDHVNLTYRATAVEVTPSKIVWSPAGQAPITIAATHTAAEGNAGVLPINPLGDWSFPGKGNVTSSVSADTVSTTCDNCVVPEFGAGFNGKLSGGKRPGGPARDAAESATFGDLAGTWDLNAESGQKAVISMIGDVFDATITQPGKEATPFTMEVSLIDGVLSGSCNDPPLDMTGQKQAVDENEPAAVVDPLAACTAGPTACKAPVLCDNVVPTVTMAAPPAAMGGVVPDGVYVLSSLTNHVGAGEMPPPAEGLLPTAITYTMFDGNYAVAQRIGTDSYAESGKVTFDATTKTLTFVPSCSSHPEFAGSTMGYTFSGETFSVLSSPSEGSTSISITTLTKKR